MLRRCMQAAMLFKILTWRATGYIREVYSGLPERPEIVRLGTNACRKSPKNIIAIADTREGPTQNTTTKIEDS